ncbi:hypothetical protein [Mucilaginibacter jinjuensis]|uniref:Uncharacterized protein n=1 Tax=Mucilaginibacter jinjuensis TaxID=1176721 RepID=A0ABY7T9X7_9SPHI|nr:hypothetical protein [Mucilaginibacter jinjuensis]WCT13305.1 hypothetical protein PQO05_05085 [Mucilaginibacter jinjuensis]
MAAYDTYGFFEDDLPEQRLSAEILLEKICIAGAIDPNFTVKHKVLLKLGFSHFGTDIDPGSCGECSC